MGAYLVTDKGEAKRRSDAVITRFPRLGERRTQLAGYLSGGEQQMLAIGRAMFHPARGVHWDGAKDEEVIVEISGIGPGTTIPVKPDAGTFLSTNK